MKLSRISGIHTETNDRVMNNFGYPAKTEFNNYFINNWIKRNAMRMRVYAYESLC